MEDYLQQFFLQNVGLCVDRFSPSWWLLIQPITILIMRIFELTTAMPYNRFQLPSQNCHFQPTLWTGQCVAGAEPLIEEGSHRHWEALGGSMWMIRWSKKYNNWLCIKPNFNILIYWWPSLTNLEMRSDCNNFGIFYCAYLDWHQLMYRKL